MKVKTLIKKFCNSKNKVNIHLNKGEWDLDISHDEAIMCNYKVDYFFIFYDKETENWEVEITVL